MPGKGPESVASDSVEDILLGRHILQLDCYDVIHG
jgi:hypothetical protein